MKHYPIAIDAIPYLIGLGAITALVFFINPLFSILPAILFIFILFFFRNPQRKIPSEENIILSPADGVVLAVAPYYDERFLKEEGIKISIFLSVFNVHINRAPIAGIIKFHAYQPGKFLPAFKSHASEINERNYLGIANNNLKVLVVQITGFVARRIVWWVKLGQQVNLGERFGLIKFGSCTEIIVPKDVEIIVKEGDKVRGGETIIGRLNNDK